MLKLTACGFVVALIQIDPWPTILRIQNPSMRGQAFHNYKDRYPFTTPKSLQNKTNSFLLNYSA